MDGFEGRVTLVTGASSGLGKATALALGARGGHVVVSSHSPERAALVAKEIAGSGGEASVAAADLLDPAAIDGMVAEVVATHGRIDHLVASGAGGSPEGLHFKLFHEMDGASFAGLANAHWLSKAHLIRAVLDPMIAAGYGKVVSITSDAGRVPTPNESMLGAGAAAVVMMARVVAREVGRYGVRVNTLAVGPLADFDMAHIVTQDQKDPGQASEAMARALERKRLFPATSREVAQTVEYLLDRTGDNITGQTWSINGGVSTS
jgi:2-hydroxycyclohexanecarboxyl-CoA dehydrogenase